MPSSSSPPKHRPSFTNGGTAPGSPSARIMDEELENNESRTSSPHPTAEELAQRDRDVHLAQSMVMAVGSTSNNRLRSGTTASVRPDGSSQGGTYGSPSGRERDRRGESEDRGQGDDDEDDDGRREGRNLADELEVDARREREAEAPASAARRARRGTGMDDPRGSASRSGASRMHNAAATRFYRANRQNLSDSSIDTQSGGFGSSEAFIDHRRNMMPPMYSMHRTPMASRRRGSDSTPSRRRPTIEDLDENPLLLGEPNQSEDAIMDGGGRRGIGRQNSNRSQQRSDRDRANSGGAGDDTRPSNRGSVVDFDAVRAEEDVCFPVNMDMYDHLDLDDFHPEDEAHLVDDRDNRRDAAHRRHALDGVPGVLANYPFPFNFDALDDYIEKEREGIPITTRRSKSHGRQTGDRPAAFSADTEYESPSSPGRMLGTTPGVGRDGRPMSAPGRALRRRKGEEGGKPASRFKKRLALFEGSAGPGDEEDFVGDLGSPPSPSYGESRPAISNTILDVKTPLLSADTMGGVYGTSFKSRRNGMPAKAGAGTAGGARPYRFSFYSNALPSTIHARSLAELPGEGQTFEELFVGRTPSEVSQHDESPQGGVGEGARTSQPGTGANTPLEASGSGRGGLGASKPRINLMRSEVDAEANTWWLDVLCPTDQEMKVLSKVFGIHPLTSEDIQMEETREKIELFRNYYFVCFRSFEQDTYSPTYLEPLNMYIIVFREGTLSFHFRGTPHPQNVRRRIKQLKDYINVTSDWISYALIDDITDAFGPLIQNIEYEVDSIDELVLILKEAEQSDMLRRIGTCRKKVMGLLRLMGNKADVVKGLSKRCNENWSVAPKSDIGLYLSDIQDHITTSTQNLTHYEKILSRSHSNYLAQISIEMTDANNQINDVLSKLTALGTVLIPMNLITGLFGMNVKVPGQEVDSLAWFFGIIGCLAAIAVGGAWLTYKVFLRS